jgi:hypothetical protein
MLRTYPGTGRDHSPCPIARENATQRGNLGTAQVGSVASAVRFIAKLILGGAVTVEFNSDIDIDRVRAADGAGSVEQGVLPRRRAGR